MAVNYGGAMRIFFALRIGRDGKNNKFATPNAEVAQLVEHQLPKLRVAGSSPVFRSLIIKALQRCEAFVFWGY